MRWLSTLLAVAPALVVTVPAGWFADVDLAAGQPGLHYCADAPDPLVGTVRLVGPGRDGTATVVADYAASPGDHPLTYSLCDATGVVEQGELDVEVTPSFSDSVGVTRVHGRDGLLRVHNRDARPVRFLWGSETEPGADGVVRVDGGRSVLVRARRHSVVWIALSHHHPDPGVGLVKGIPLPSGTRPQPPGVPHGATMMDALTSLWALRAVHSFGLD